MLTLSDIRRILLTAAAGIPLAAVPAACSSTAPTGTALPGSETRTTPARKSVKKHAPSTGPRSARFYDEKGPTHRVTFCAPLAVAKTYWRAGSVEDCPARLNDHKLVQAYPHRQWPAVNGHPSISVVEDVERSKSESAPEDPQCCYRIEWRPPPQDFLGRPLMGPGGPVLAGIRSGEDWSSGHEPLRPLVNRLSAHQERILAEQWLADGLMEHASVASFGRVVLELMALGAPSDLVSGALEAAQDEIRHTQRCFELASLYGADCVQPGPLAAPAPREQDLAAFAAHTFAEGCVGETVASFVALGSLRPCTEAQVREVLEEIIRDETEHAALAWATVAWAIQVGGEGVMEAVSEEALRRRPSAACSGLAPRSADDKFFEAHGRLSEARKAQIGRRAWSDVIEPALAELMGSVGS